MATLNTRIILRNDSSANWLTNESQVLLKGEVGIEFLESGKVKMKVGDGTKPWSELAYFGGEESHVFQAEVNVAEKETKDAALVRAVGSVTPTVGDIAVIKELITGDKYSYTAYVFNGTSWEAMDGNYSSDNVFFKENMTVTTKVGTITELTNGSATFETAGKSLTQVLNALLAEEKNPETTDPTISLSASGGSGEVGTSYTLPTATLKLTGVGSYTYGPATGVTVEVGKAKITQGSNSASNTSVMVKDSTFTLKATDTETIYLDTAKSYTFNGEATHTDGAVPVTNLGNEYADGQIESTKLTKSATATFTGYRSFFYGALKVAPSTTTITSEHIRALTNGGNYNAAKSLEIKADGATDLKAFIVAIPNANTRAGVTHVDSTAGMTVDMTDSYIKSDSTISVADARGTVEGVDTNPVAYKVWIWEPASIDSGAVHKITLG